ncbi:phage integrase Arm DNA-binding domain-containing protein [Buttiauxella sp. A111]|uniref:phage integrase Arm DNA-binding domain-containing protein n=1 Tax=Buttiauxella sp. A111 TaxID=2563088 RepID=UPI0010E191A3|nr:phage integrase Arm DNA-binding domain-containing protein [Buttiauxella sp. A111]GDX06679.1 integrase [Buttiauxella sp. A111]
MAARPRKHNISTPNLYCKLDKRNSKTYWQYRHPITGVFVGFGTDEDAAKSAAEEMNRILSEQENTQSYLLVDMAIKAQAKREPGVRVKNWVNRYMLVQQDRMDNGEIRKPTYKSRKNCSNTLSLRMPNLRLQDVDTKMLATIIDEYKAAGKVRMAQLLRAVWIDVFKEAQHAGEVPAGYNPALAVRNPKNKVSRSRLTFEQWQKIYDHASGLAPFAQNSMLLALVTGQRRGDLVEMKFSDVWDGYLHIIQSKTGVRLALPLTLKCEAIDLTLGEIISRCRDRVVSKYMLHSQRNHASNKAGEKIDVNSLSRVFLEARVKSGLTFPKGSTPPSFHEQRSLSSRLYEAQGINVKTLLGHKTDAMSEQYKDERGQGWITLAV